MIHDDELPGVLVSIIIVCGIALLISAYGGAGLSMVLVAIRGM